MSRWGAILAIVALSSFARAQAGSDDQARAKVLFDEGHAAMDRQEHALACEKFEASLALFRRASTLLNLGACHEGLGHTATALRHWQLGAAALESTDARLDIAKEHIAALDQLAPRLRVGLPEEMPAATVIRLDGEAVTRASLEGELRLDPGEHHFEIDAPGHERSSLTVVLHDAGDQGIDLTLGPALYVAPPPPPPPPPPVLPAPLPPEEGHTIPVWTWPVGIVGLLSGGAAIGLAIDYANTVSEQESRCRGDLAQCQPDPPGSYDPADDNARKDRDAVIGVVLGTTGGAAIVAAIIGAIVGEGSSVAIRRGGVLLRF